MREPLVGIIGASGAVGRVVARQLHALHTARLRLGARNTFPVYRLAEKLGGPAEIAYVDVCNAESLARFCSDCQVVVNCVGPSFRLLDLAARGAFAAGADYVDPGGNEPLYERLAGLDFKHWGRVALLTAGMMPGLSALLVRWLAEETPGRARRLLAYVGGRDRLSVGSAIDYILSLKQAHSDSLSVWRDGERIVRGLVPLTDADLPFFPRGITAYPYLSTESERLARSLRLTEVRWYNVFEGGHMLKALGRLQGAALGQADANEAAADLTKAAELDLFGLPRYQLLYLQLEGEANGAAATRSLLVQGSGAHELTGCVSAVAVLALLNGDVPPGIHFAGEALSTEAVNQLRKMSAVTTFQLIEAETGADQFDEEGLL